MSNAVGQGVGLPGARARNYEERRKPVLDGALLFWVQPGEVRCVSHRGEANRKPHQQARLSANLQIFRHPVRF